MNIADYISILNSNTESVLQTVNNISAEQLSFSKDGRWSILQVLEHICITEYSVCRLLAKPSETISDADEIIGKEKMQRRVVGGRSYKLSAPERLLPKGEITDAAAFEKRFTEQREALKQDLLSGKIAVDNRVFKHLVIGDMTITDWLYFLVYHTERHADQVRDLVKEGIEL